MLCLYMQNILKRTDCKRGYERSVPAGTKTVKFSIPKGTSIISPLTTKTVSTCLAYWSFSKTHLLTAMLGTAVSGRSIIVLYAVTTQPATGSHRGIN